MTQSGSHRHLRSLLTVFAVAGLSACAALDGEETQTARITVTELGIVSAAAADVDHAEPWLAVDPADPMHAVAVGLAGSGSRTMAYVTFDGGTSWRRVSPPESEDNAFPGGDPVAVFDGDGNVFIATIIPFRVWKSSDGGVNWDAPVVVPGRSYDREYLAVRTAPNAPDTLYATGKIPIEVFGWIAEDVLALSRSVDGGATFEYPRLFLPDPTRTIVQAPGGMLVTPDGKILISANAHDVPVQDPMLLANHIWVMRSDDGGRSFDEPVAAAPLRMHANRSGLFSMVKGLSSSGMAMDTARTSRFRGRLYLTLLSVHEGRLQVLVAASADTGRTWTDPVVVNDDTGSANHSNPAITVTDTGALVVLWNDRRADPDDLCFRARVSASIDGGASFLPSVPLTTTDVCPVAGETEDFTTGRFRHRFANGGETQGLAPVPGGGVLAVWVDGVDGVMQLRASAIRLSQASGR